MCEDVQLMEQSFPCKMFLKEKKKVNLKKTERDCFYFKHDIESPRKTQGVHDKERELSYLSTLNIKSYFGKL